jgi:transposase, IS5 family
VYRDFTRVGGEKMPDAKTMARWGTALGPEVIKQIRERIVEIARDQGLAVGGKMRVDTTVVETNIHYPTDSGLLGDGVRVLIRTMKRIISIAGAAGAKLCDRGRSVKLRVLDIARAARAKGQPSQDRMKRAYSQLLNSTSRLVGQAKRFSREIAAGVKCASTALQQLALECLGHELDVIVPRVQQVMKQARARIFRGNTRFEAKLLSLFSRQPRLFARARRPSPTNLANGQAAGSRKPDRDRLRGLRPATQ